MKNQLTSRILTMSLFALVTLFFAGKTSAAYEGYLQITDAKGKVTKVIVAKDGSFTTPPLAAGRIKVHFFWDRAEGTANGKAYNQNNARSNHPKSADVSQTVFNYEVKAPRDVATGQSSGKRMHKPVTITKEWGASTPMLGKTTSSILIGDVTIDDDCDGITGKISFKSRTGSVMTFDDLPSSSK